MRLAGERAAARARALVDSFRPRLAPSADAPRVLLSAFGPFPGVPRNATAEIVRAVAASAGIALRAPSFRAPEFLAGRGELALASGRTCRCSILILPVVWDAAAALVAKEARAARASLVLMSGVAGPAQPIYVEAVATGARAASRDAFGLRPVRRSISARSLPATFDVDTARDAIDRALHAELAGAPALGEVIHGAVRRESRGENAYVCNATAHVAARAVRRSVAVLRSRGEPEGLRVARFGPAKHGFVHWPRDIAPEHAPACARVLLAMVDALA